MARKRKPTKGKPKVNEELEGFDIKIDSFGEIHSSIDVSKINEFLNRKVDDKKLRDRPEFQKGKEDKDDQE